MAMTPRAQQHHQQEAPKTLGRHPRSITAPLAAFTMALLLGSYCISSIRAARREARYNPAASDNNNTVAAGSSSGSSLTSATWVAKALEEERRERERVREKEREKGSR
ncbi:hypothetical protein VTN77DRAFT_1147 [Rasamsonia byssochlamydoides]|uniref:uncharacterized protein n=1 Tax=Rasamsonia byssochlamydoides TaxID=89139 RepID=UPI0037449A08